jgi:hypothetical protein
MNNYSIEEYKSLREEIGRFENDVIKINQFGLTAAAVLISFTFTKAIPDALRWISLFSPCVILGPLVFLQTQRILSIWKIGRYIELSLEPSLGFHWESVNFKFRNLDKPQHPKIFSFAVSSTLPAILIQIICPLLALFQKPNNWYFYGILCLGLIISLGLQIKSILNTNPTDKLKNDMEKALKDTIKNT